MTKGRAKESGSLMADLAQAIVEFKSSLPAGSYLPWQTPVATSSLGNSQAPAKELQ